MLDFSKNYFELFGLPATYVVDMQMLRDRYRELQGLVHPDRYAATSSDAEKRQAQQAAGHVNMAFETLKEPILRAQYLLKLHGIDMELHSETTRDTAFLMEQLELREELEEIRSSDDSLDLIAEFMQRVSAMLKNLISSIALDFDTPSAGQLEDVRETIRKMQFLNKLYNEAEAVEAALEDELN